MGDGVRIARVLGIPIRVQWSWFVVLALITWTLAVGYFPAHLPDATDELTWLYGLIAALLLFASVLLHELSHAVVARRTGLPVAGITLHIFGGVAQLEREPDSPRREFLMAVVGPLTSYAVAGVAWLVLRTWALPPAWEAVAVYVGFVNLVVGTFNLVPGFPLDGGRLLRSALWAWRGDLAWATRLASGAGTAFAYLLVAAGGVRLVSGELVGGVWLVLIGLFLLQAAGASYRQLVTRQALEGVSVAEAMTRNVVVVPAGASIAELVDGWFWPHHVTSFPVVSDIARRDGVLGIVTIHQVRAVPREAWGTTRVADVMVKLREDLVIGPWASCWEALARLSTNRVGRLAVREGARLVGYLSVRDVVHLLTLQTAGRERGRGTRGPAATDPAEPLDRAA
jgi:Zn-dependent protease